MKIHNLQKIYDSLNEEKFEVNSETMEKARSPILKMLELSNGSFLLGNEDNKNELIRGKPAGIKKVNAQVKC